MTSTFDADGEKKAPPCGSGNDLSTETNTTLDATPLVGRRTRMELLKVISLLLYAGTELLEIRRLPSQRGWELRSSPSPLTLLHGGSTRRSSTWNKPEETAPK